MRQPVHDDKLAGGGSGFAQESDPEYMRMIKEGRTEEEILSKQKAKQGLSLLQAPSMNLTAYQLIIKVFKAEKLCPLSDDGKQPYYPDAFLTFRSQGVT